MDAGEPALTAVLGDGQPVALGPRHARIDGESPLSLTGPVVLAVRISPRGPDQGGVIDVELDIHEAVGDLVAVVGDRPADPDGAPVRLPFALADPLGGLVAGLGLEILDIVAQLDRQHAVVVAQCQGHMSLLLYGEIIWCEKSPLRGPRGLP